MDLDSNHSQGNPLIRRLLHYRPEPGLGPLESAYRISHLRADIELFQILICIGFLFFILYGWIDYQLFGITNILRTLILVRGAFIGISIVILLVLRRIESYRLFDWLMFSWMALLAGMIFYIDSTRSASFSYHVVIDLVLLIAFYTSMPIGLIFRFVPATLLSIGEIILLLFFRHGIDPIGIRSMIFGILMGNVIGLVISIRLNNFRRSQFKAQYEERQTRQEIERLAMTDDLTKVLNHRSFFELAEHEFEHARRYSRPLSALVLDLDHFKRVNDRYGHQIGNRLLYAIARQCSAELRQADIFGRYGGDEFVLLLPETDFSQAMIVAERLRQSIKTVKVNPNRNTDLFITMSLGVATLDESCESVAELLERADHAMYIAKQSGRDRIKAWKNE